MLRKLVSSAIVFVSCLLAVDGEEIRGKVKSIDADKNVVVVIVDDKDQTFTVPKDAKIYSPGKAKKGQAAPEIILTFANIKTDNTVTVTTEKKDGKDLVTAVKIDPEMKKKKKKGN
jgi:hypothetical protein